MIEEQNFVSFTTEALEMAKQMQIQQVIEDKKSLRLYIDGKGCDGFYYGVCFDSKMDGDKIFDHQGIELLVDNEAFGFVAGSSIEWVDDDPGKGFLVNNPRHHQFRGKFYKKSDWQNKIIK